MTDEQTPETETQTEPTQETDEQTETKPGGRPPSTDVRCERPRPSAMPCESS